MLTARSRGRGEGALGLDKGVEAEGEVFHGHEVGAVLLAHLVDADDVGVVNGGGHARLAVEPLHVGGIAAHVGVHHLRARTLPVWVSQTR